jgi:hypothetical protein
MADPIRIQFYGGPCNGQVKPVTVDQIRAHAVSCGGSNYVIAIGPDAQYRATWAKQAAQGEQNAAPGSHAQFDSAWARLMRSLAFTLPENTRRVQAASQRIRSAVR